MGSPRNASATIFRGESGATPSTFSQAALELMYEEIDRER